MFIHLDYLIILSLLSKEKPHITLHQNPHLFNRLMYATSFNFLELQWFSLSIMAQSTGAVEYTNYFSAEG